MSCIWEYKQPVNIVFGNGVINRIPEFVKEYPRPLIIASKSVVYNGLTDKLQSQLRQSDLYTDVSSNPDVEEVNRCAAFIKEHDNSVIIAIGGGSVIDLGKAASLLLEDIRCCYENPAGLFEKQLPVIAVPTTAGTGSEVTAVSVLTDRKLGRKSPLSMDAFYPILAVVDPELLYTLPKKVTASSGIDVLCHAIEGYWSRYTQPITRAIAVSAIKDIIRYLPIAYEEPENKEAREKTAQASLLAGLAFNLPKTTAAHACSFPLTNLYRIPHGEACGLTIDYFMEINKKHPRVQQLAVELNYKDVDAFTEAVKELKRKIHLTAGLKRFQLTEEQLEELVRTSRHPNLYNNPIEITDEILWDLYRKLNEY